MDDNGSIALCYSRSSSTAGDYPSMAFTGRLASDPLGQMTFGETIAYTGTGTQGSGCGNRYGDYSETTLDPDGITFWHTGEYIASGGSQKTRIYSFQLPTITAVQSLNSASAAVYAAYQDANSLIVNANNLAPSSHMVVDLFDASGRKISGKNFSDIHDKLATSFDVSKTAKGIYLVRIGNEKFQKVLKVNLQ
jgi:hypothetical protein